MQSKYSKLTFFTHKKLWVFFCQIKLCFFRVHIFLVGENPLFFLLKYDIFISTKDIWIVSEVSRQVAWGKPKRTRKGGMHRFTFENSVNPITKISDIVLLNISVTEFEKSATDRQTKRNWKRKPEPGNLNESKEKCQISIGKRKPHQIILVDDRR